MPEQYIKHLRAILANDQRVLEEKDEQYGGSWCARGGTGAYFVAVRKWDRMENWLKHHHWDVFAAMRADNRPESFIEDLRDYRRYLVLMEAKAIEDGILPLPEDPDTGIAGAPETVLTGGDWHSIPKGRWEDSKSMWRHIKTYFTGTKGVFGERVKAFEILLGIEEGEKAPCARCGHRDWVWMREGACSACREPFEMSGEASHPACGEEPRRITYKETLRDG